MYDVILYNPEIPPNTGNVMRLCANTGQRLHLIEPLGFSLEDRLLRRAGLDYRDRVAVRVHPSLGACLDLVQPTRLFAATTRGNTRYTDPRYGPGDAFLFGPETSGLPRTVLDLLPPAHRIGIPMLPDNRSLNLSNAVAVIVFEAWRQAGFPGASMQAPGSSAP